MILKDLRKPVAGMILLQMDSNVNFLKHHFSLDIFSCTFSGYHKILFLGNRNNLLVLLTKYLHGGQGYCHEHTNRERIYAIGFTRAKIRISLLKFPFLNIMIFSNCVIILISY